ncbi:hypothetical protein J7T55_001060 [Diaporthe amygdali]|uniref:uncharacterized protein n=1 Tax=Phomopsis amygdali TaxID=1214568 RepID=UPI0022FE09AB|nr:uncharacterized protein J7T55_001060 [Diaporthe amygdali]KAJ0120204.1 hypothetical protein J7T55_001060 [Diaporthe amygdali]
MRSPSGASAQQMSSFYNSRLAGSRRKGLPIETRSSPAASQDPALLDATAILIDPRDPPRRDGHWIRAGHCINAIFFMSSRPPQSPVLSRFSNSTVPGRLHLPAEVLTPIVEEVCITAELDNLG